MGIFKKRKYFIGGYEGDQLEPIVKGLIDDAKEMDNLPGLAEVCSGVVSVLSGGSLDEIEKKLWTLT